MSDLAAVGALIGDRTRASMLARLLDGGATSASELAAAAGASSSLASAHLRKLLEAAWSASRRAGGSGCAGRGCATTTWLACWGPR